MEGDSCKFAVWTGRAPLYDHRVILKASTLDSKQMWVKRIRELIQEKYFYMEVAMCEPGINNKSNRNSKEFEIDTNNDIIETCSSTASNTSSSGNKVKKRVFNLKNN
jgi:triple functional domain protein